MRTLEQRRLSPGEASLINADVGAVVAQARIDGVVEPAILEQALHTLAEDHPLLRSRIIDDAAGYLLQYAAGAGPSLRVVDTDEDPFALELNTALTREREVARAALFRHAGDSVVSLAVHHSVADGISTTTLLHMLLDYYTAAAEGRAPAKAHGRGLRPALDSLLAGHQGAEEFPALLNPPTAALLPASALGHPVPAQRFGVGHLSLDRRATTDLQRQAHALGATVTGLLGGTLAAVLSHMVDGTIIFRFWVDLRSRLQPPLRPDDELLAVGYVSTAISTGQGDSAEYAREITTQLKTSVDQGFPQRSVLTLDAEPGHATPGTVTLAVSNLGRLDTPPLPAGAELRSVRFGTTSPQQNPILFASTTDGRLELDFTYDRTYFTDEQMNRFITEIRSGLTQFISGAASRT
ncbi:phthiocerol/phthiodiolone dimycocerosyl transferase family protein [Nocardia pseudobrasiliensis]|uniref:Phthiocerol/phthiodiolone dimycocerosyl transferase n=1 Tax=Nocardia pseudobrasiliensis TaxID=45979 RepID=A0A370IE37_9NOCA|nr:condensation domain-containing protein [Nocardia pseudobrasiliensis]RDI68401.1 condensation domain-containing protein [Nocardia pseudobrasiliensis]